MNRTSFGRFPGAVWRSVRTFASAHRFWSVLIVIVVFYGGYRAYAAVTAAPTATRYITTTVATGTVVATMSETGQVSASHQITLSPQASGQIIGIYVQPGSRVAAGQVIAQLDASTAEQSLKSAELSLQNAELSYQQTTATSTLALNLLNAQDGVTTAQIALAKAHDDAYASIASIYTDLSSVITGLNSTLYDYNVAGRANQQNIAAYTDLVSAHDNSIPIYENAATTNYTAAVTAYDAALATYQATSRNAPNASVAALAKTTYAATQAVAQAVQSSHDFFDRVSTDYSLYNLGTSPTLSGLLASTNAYTTTVATDLSNALTDETSLVTAEQSLAAAQNTLQTTEGGSNALTVQSAALSLQQAKDAVATAEQNLANYTVTAPFAGTIASVGVQQYDRVSSGTSIATLVTSQETAAITVNEVDASKLKIGQAATLTFDALPGISIPGTVVSIDRVGTVSQGVVSYAAVIAFNTENAQVMPGMSVTADIVTGSETGLVVPSAAVTTRGSSSSVQVFNPPLPRGSRASGAVSPPPPKTVLVTTGLSNALQTIIKSGLTAGEQVVIETIASTATPVAPSAAAQKTSLFGGGRPGRGAAFHAIGG